jgi:hypothetical protein
MSITIVKETIAKRPFAHAHVNCAGCGAQSETQGACGAGCDEHARGLAMAHAVVVQKWTPTSRIIREGRKTLSLLEYLCAPCSAATL